MAKIDWEFTEDGDLVAGEPLLDIEGQILYRHNDGSIDTDIRDDGVEIRDIGLTYDLEAEKQTIMNRLKTETPDWYHHPSMGGNLSDLIGMKNTRATGDYGAELIRSALTYKGLYDGNSITIRPVPISNTSIMFNIEIKKQSTEVYRVPLVFDLTFGVISIYEV